MVMYPFVLFSGKLEYQAQSPDENALVSAARNFEFVFKERSPDSITISVLGKEEVYDLLCILDFNNVRKRMSVVVQREGKIMLLCKGADSIIFERLTPSMDDLRTKTQEHLNVSKVECKIGAYTLYIMIFFEYIQFLLSLNVEICW